MNKLGSNSKPPWQKNQKKKQNTEGGRHKKDTFALSFAPLCVA